ncbi:MAG: ligase-associated DNA damage response exonuclease, partial [Pseudomonadota bacterium]
RAGHSAVLATSATIAIMAVRYGEDFTSARQPVTTGERVIINGVSVHLVPAGHVLGSAQAVIEHKGLRMVVTGDYKRRRDPTCEAFEVVPCDVFISEATFALPVFHHPDTAGEIRKLISSQESFPNRTYLVGAYALGKAQRIICHLREEGYDRPIYIHGALRTLCALYEEMGISLGELRPATIKDGGGNKQDFAGEIVLCPPSAIQTSWARRFPDPIPCFASGWMRIRQRAKQRGVELPLIISDHADWQELTDTVEDVNPEQLWVTHGREDALVRWAETKGRRARPLRLVGYEDEND